MSETISVKACPYCKYPPVLTNIIKDGTWYAECFDSECERHMRTAPLCTKASAIDAWNLMVEEQVAHDGLEPDPNTPGLKPCNYCEDGGEPRIVSDGFFYVAGCYECGYTMGAYYTKESAIAAWNTRADDVPEHPVDNAQADSRERLEADICDWLTRDLQGNPLYEVFADSVEPGSMPEIRRWLDRQEAITKNECREEHRQRLGELHDLLDEAAREREELARRVDYNGELAEKVKRERNNLQFENDALNERISKSAAPETAETAETDAAKVNMRDFDADSRERLRADVYEGFSAVDLPEQMRDVLRSRVHTWLDRQEAITSSEWCYSHDALEEELERVRAERDEWKLRFEGMCDTRADDAPKRTCELEETESYECRRFDTAEPKLYATRLTVHVLECSECGRTCEHVNGTYPRCPYCSAVNVLDENYEPQVIKNAENYKLADDSRPQVIAIGEKHKLADKHDSRERLEEDVREICWGYDFYRNDAQKHYLYERGLDVREDIVTTNYDGHVLATVIMHLLDRQAAITRREFDGECEFCQSEVARLQNHVDDLKAEVEAQRKRANDAERGVLNKAWYVSRDRYEDDIAELTAELDKANNAGDKLMNKLIDMTTERDDLRRITKELEERNGELLEGRAHWIDQAVSIYRRFYPHNEYAVPADVSSMVIAKIDELIAERDELRDELEFEKSENGWARDFLNRMGPKCGTADCPSLVAYVNNLEAERDELRDKLDEKQHVCDVQRESFRKMEKLLADAKAADYVAMRDEAEMLSAENARLKAENRELHMKVHGAPF